MVTGTSLDYTISSPGGLDDAILAARNPATRPDARKWNLWHGRRPIREETFRGWFGARVQPLQRESVKALLQRLDHFLVVSASSRPKFVLPLGSFASLGVSRGALEAILDAPVVVTSEALYTTAAFVPSLRVYAGYDGSRYASSTRKLFRNRQGATVSVEAYASEVLRRLSYDVVFPSVFRRFFHALVDRPASHFQPGIWPRAFLGGRLSPLERVARSLERLEAAKREGFAVRLERDLAAIAHRPPYRLYPEPQGSIPYVGRYLSRSRFDNLLQVVGERRLLALMDAFARGYDPVAADWFAWEPGGGRAFFCEVKSLGDHLRDSQKQSILWCQRHGLLEYRLLEVLHAPRPVGTVLNAATARRPRPT